MRDADPLEPGNGADRVEREFTHGAVGERVGYSPELAAIVLDAVASGKTVQAVCGEDARLPSAGTVRRWVMLNVGRQEDERGQVLRQGFGDQMMVALEMQAEAMADDCLAIADEDEEIAVAGDQVTVRNSTAHRTLRIKTRQYLMAANARAKWGVQKTAAPVQSGPLRISSPIRRRPNEPLLLDGVAEPTDERPLTGNLHADTRGS